MNEPQGTLLVKRLAVGERSWFAGNSSPKRANPRTEGISLGLPAINEALDVGRRKKIGISLRWFDGNVRQQRHAYMVRRKRTWVIESAPLRSSLFDELSEDVLVLILVEPWSNEIKSDWTFSISLIKPGQREHQFLFNELLKHIEGGATRIIPSAHHEDVLLMARSCLPLLGGARVTTSDMTATERDALVNWLIRYLRLEDIITLTKNEDDESITQILEGMGHKIEKYSPRQLADTIATYPGVELLCDPNTRDLLARRRFPRQTKNYPRAKRWRRGSPSARKFVRTLGLPSPLAGKPVESLPDHEDIEAYPAAGPLHSYQEDIARGMIEVLSGKTARQRRAVVWLPTGTGKTRVTVETLLMNCRLEAPRNCILWVANREELCEQAIEAFKQMWTVRGYETPSAGHGGVPVLRFHRMFGSRTWQDLTTLPTIVIASIQSLVSRIKDEEYEEFLAIIGRRCSAIVFDEAHHVVAPGYTRVMRALGLTGRYNYLGDNQATAPPLFGLTATPSRAGDDETRQLSRRFGGRLLEPQPPFQRIEEFARQGYLATPTHEVIQTGAQIRLNKKELEHVQTFHTLPAKALEKLGANEQRTVAILNDLEPRLTNLRSVLVFACSVQHARIMAEVLVRRGHSAAVLHGATPKAVRWNTIRQFRLGRIQILVNCSLLTTGFDAPNVDAIVLARPVESRVLYAQMVGRGLRGPHNGGTEHCLVLDYEDAAGEFPDLDALRETFRRDFLMIQE